MAFSLLLLSAPLVWLGATQLQKSSSPIAPAWLGNGYVTLGDSRSIVRYMKSGRHTCTDGDNFTHTSCVNKRVGHFERNVVIKCMACMPHQSGRGSMAQFCSEKPDGNGNMKVSQVGYDDTQCQQPQGQWGFLSGTEKSVPSVHAGCFQDDPFYWATANVPVAVPAPIPCEFAEYSSLSRTSCRDSPRGASCTAALNTCKNHDSGEVNLWCGQISGSRCMQNPHHHTEGRTSIEFTCAWNEVNFAAVYYDFENDSTAKVMV